jgi:hypothetical protein
MEEMPMADIIQVRRDTTVNWESANPVLADGEMGFDITTKKFKVGNGTTNWNALEYNTVSGTPTALSDLTKDINFDERYYTKTEINAKLLVQFYTQTSLSIDGANGNFFLVTVSVNASFSLSNIATGTMYYFVITNNGASDITITLPNTADIKSSATVIIKAGKTKEIAMIFNGTKRYWQISEELS